MDDKIEPSKGRRRFGGFSGLEVGSIFIPLVYDYFFCSLRKTRGLYTSLTFSVADLR